MILLIMKIMMLLLSYYLCLIFLICFIYQKFLIYILICFILTWLIYNICICFFLVCITASRSSLQFCIPAFLVHYIALERKTQLSYCPLFYYRHSDLSTNDRYGIPIWWYLVPGVAHIGTLVETRCYIMHHIDKAIQSKKNSVPMYVP